MADPVDDAWRALERTAIRSSWRGVFVRETAGARRRASLWTLVHVLWAVCELRRLGRRVDVTIPERIVERHRRGDAYAATPHGDVYFDDNAWLGLASVDLAAATGSDDALARARRLAGFVCSGADPDGGLRWAERSTSRNTCSTASAAWLTLASGGDRACADRAMDWLAATLRGDDGLFADRVDRGVIDPTIWSYNQGASVAALRLLGRGEEADRTARASLDVFVGQRRWTEPPPFLAIWFRAVLSVPTARDAAGASLREHVDEVLRRGLDRDTGLFTCGGIGSYGGTTIDQAATVQLLAFREMSS